ncbi:M15 family metallopeptidase [Flavobacterium sp. GT3R68]|uniref:M15 family metallopeptidase n=1 Tax=Flavobacterium sp. GT3R68 TaxID=2594437 RepID=UPI000F8863CF|nr:M15 family metallopeptidase [Flavobacterium sp. GT3R68]RTY93599.1 peptidase M15 [Flavobacterium sp. GSN2]TRW91680.1 M15 family metallopeptidase [Flavobacterium sp. GT3R68]
MPSSIKLLILILSMFLFSCRAKVVDTETPGNTPNKTKPVIVSNRTPTSPEVKLPEVNDSTFVNLKIYSQDFILDMKYATTDNFLKAKVYDCAECFLRYKTVKSLLEANERFVKKGYRIKIYDCYRPLDIQKRMWAIVSNPEYVADPKKGSIHNRGGAVDITLVDKNGKELDMGTAFDHFGIEASHQYLNVSDEVLANRKLLKKIMLKSGFKSFDSEWWHYNIKNAKLERVSNFKWECD